MFSKAVDLSLLYRWIIFAIFTVNLYKCTEKNEYEEFGFKVKWRRQIDDVPEAAPL